MRDDYTDISIVLDRSGSMQGIASDMVGGLQTFLDDQRKVPGKCIVNLYQFDNYYDIVFEDKYIHDLPLIQLQPRNATALHDAVGRTINRTGERLRGMPEHERPSRVFMLIVTDGLENCSKEFNAAQVRQMVEHQKNVYNWNFVYVGANQDAVLVAKELTGMGAGKAFTYHASAEGTRQLFAAVSRNTVRSRNMDQQTYTNSVAADSFFTDEDKKEAEEIAKKKTKRTGSSA
jgi:uncharacterized protein YegL